MTTEYLPTLVVTTGEPAGIGPDICLQAAQQPFDCRLIFLADRNLLRTRAETLQLPVQFADSGTIPPGRHQPGRLYVHHVPLARKVEAGVLNPANAAYVTALLRQATTGCCSQQYDAMVTAPVHKGIINDAGIPFTGHTEYLAGLTHSQVVMMLIGGGMRVALATTHLPLKDVAAAITAENLESKLRIIHHDLIARFALSRPRIAVAGLNPHAGESGHLGREEIDIIIPVLEKLRGEGIRLSGPLPADTLFNPHQLAQYDCILAMFHDQGLPVLKHASFGTGVNITLGLPIIRTSVDHGTALDLAGSGKTESGSLVTAIQAAIELAKNTRLTDTHGHTGDGR
ncbi:MAG: 4-hydroxythreonine-4-phosphate dehydrogenase PdxA [Nitrosomonas sp.]|nr:4-hydroxythreonine-4-phosphate dehydrogenase PdxA [Nitrosomonas sp.]